MKKFLVLLLAAVCLMLSACQGLGDWLFENDPAPVTPSATPSQAPTLAPGPPRNSLFGVSWSGRNVVQPLTNDSRFDAQWLPLAYEGLFHLDEKFQPQPLLCAHWTTEDNKTFVLTLRAGVRFHDGIPMTAQDVAWSLNEAKKADSPYAARLDELRTARALDDATLEVVLSRPNPRFTALLTIPIVPADSALMEIAPGTGPYVPTMDDSFPHLSAFDSWWQNKALPLSRLELIPVGSGDQLINAFASRTLSLAVYNPSDVTGVRFRSDYETWEFGTPILEYIGFNTARTPLSDPRLRRALAAVIDREAVSRDDNDPRWTVPAALPIPPESPLYDTALAISYGFDPARAAILLGETGYDDWDEDGVLETVRGRRSYPLELTMLVCEENPHRVAAARGIAAELTGAGALIHLEELPLAAYTDALTKGQFDLYYGAAALTADFSPLPFFKGGSLGYGGYADAQALALWEEASAGTPGGAAWNAFWALFMEEAPIVPVLFQRQALLTQRGLVAEPHPTWENPFYLLENWHME